MNHGHAYIRRRDDMQTWIIDMMEQFGYLGILFMMAIENLFPPIPSEVILPFGGL